MTAKAGRNADFWVAEGTPVAFTDEATTDQDANHTIFRVTNQVKSFFDTATAIVVKKDTVIQSAALYEVQHAAGQIRFLSGIGAGHTVTITGAYLPASRCGGGKEWTGDLEHAVEDSTDFVTGATGWRAKTAIGLNDGSASCSRWWWDAAFLTSLTAGAIIAVRLYVDYANTISYSSYAKIASDSVATVVDGIIDEDIDFELTGGVWYRPA